MLGLCSRIGAVDPGLSDSLFLFLSCSGLFIDRLLLIVGLCSLIVDGLLHIGLGSQGIDGLLLIVLESLFAVR